MPEQENKNEKENLVSVSPAEIWGKVITELRDRNLKLLFIACGEISNVEILDNTFVITAQENNKIVIDTPANIEVLTEIISKYLVGCKVLIKEENTQKEEIIPSQRLIELFGNKLIIGE